MSVAPFVQDLSCKEQYHFVNIMSQTMRVLVGESCSKDYLPNMDKDYSSKFIPSNSKYPSMKKVNDHACVSLVDIVAHLLAFSDDIPCVSQSDILLGSHRDVSHICHSAAVQHVIRRGIDVCGLEVALSGLMTLIHLHQQSQTVNLAGKNRHYSTVI
jgi:hypothetical protein